MGIIQIRIPMVATRTPMLITARIAPVVAMGYNPNTNTGGGGTFNQGGYLITLP